MSAMNDDLVRQLRVVASRAEAPPGPECLDEGEIAAFVDDTLIAERRERALTHVSECDRCRRAIASVSRALADSRVAAEVRRIRGERSWVLPAAAAAAAVIAFLILAPATDQPPILRDSAVTTTVAPVPTGPRGIVTAAPALQWTSVPRADRYRARILDERGQVLWEGEITDTVAPIPPATGLVPGVSYFWKVEARTGWDRWVSSELVEFKVQPGAR